MTAYAFGGVGQRLAEDRAFALPITLAVLWAAFAANFFGMKVAKWISALGGSSTFIIGAVLVALAIGAGLRSGIATRFALLPKANLDTVNFWSQIAFAFVGLELAPIVSAEIRNPRRDLPRAAAISGVISAAFYIAMTAALLVLLKPEEISPMTGLAQAGAVGAQKLGAPILSILLATLIGIALAGQLDTWIAGNTRLPYAIGLDRYLAGCVWTYSSALGHSLRVLARAGGGGDALLAHGAIGRDGQGGLPNHGGHDVDRDVHSVRVHFRRGIPIREPYRGRVRTGGDIDRHRISGNSS